MTDRTKVLTVLLDKAYRDDDVQDIKDAICMLKGVVKVDHIVNDVTQWQAENSAKRELIDKLWDVLK